MDARPGRSAWNEAGTWEESALDVPAFRQFVQDRPELLALGGRRLLEVAELDGRGSVVFSGGRRRLGFKLEARLRYDGGELRVLRVSDSRKVRSEWTATGGEPGPAEAQVFEAFLAALNTFID